jgi:hypothetical protein
MARFTVRAEISRRKKASRRAGLEAGAGLEVGLAGGKKKSGEAAFVLAYLGVKEG